MGVGDWSPVAAAAAGGVGEAMLGEEVFLLEKTLQAGLENIYQSSTALAL